MKNLFTSYKEWIRRKILVIHMSTPHMDVEKELASCGIDFDSWKFDEVNLEEAWMGQIVFKNFYSHCVKIMNK